MATIGYQHFHNNDSNWFPDFGATNHVTNDMNNFTSVSEYSGSQQIRMGNGAALPILKTCSSNLTSSTFNCDPSIHLKNLLYVPHIIQRI